MSNVRNFGVVIGRLAKAPHVFDNADGSHKVSVTVAVRENYKNKEGKYPTQFIQLQRFVGKDATAEYNLYKNMESGLKVGFEFTVRQNKYVNKAGETVYDQILVITSVDFLETKAEVARRKASADAAKEDEAEEAPASTEEPFME